MPGMNGLETALRMKEDGVPTPVIAFTNTNVQRAKDLAPAEAFADFLSKSVPQKLLVDHLHMWYARRG